MCVNQNLMLNFLTVIFLTTDRVINRIFVVIIIIIIIIMATVCIAQQT